MKKRKSSVAPSGHWYVQFRMPGSPWVWMKLGGSGSTTNPADAHKFSDRESAEEWVSRQYRGGSSSVEWRTQWRP